MTRLMILTMMAAVVTAGLAGCEPADMEHGPEVAMGPVERAALDRLIEQREARQQTHEKLQKTLVEFIFRQPVEFGVALDWLRDVAELNINVNWGALAAIGITRNQPEITIRLRDVTVETALRAVLSRAAGREDVLAYAVEGNVIKISTRDDLAVHKHVEIYDVRDLIEIAEEHERESRAWAEEAEVEADRWETERHPGPRSAAVEKLKTLIRVHVLPDTWSPTGDANMYELADLLVVKQTAVGHRDVAMLLQAIRLKLAERAELER
jgi:hypothetical protein